MKEIFKVITPDKKIFYLSANYDKSFMRMAQISSWYGVLYEKTGFHKKEEVNQDVLTLTQLEKTLENL